MVNKAELEAAYIKRLNEDFEYFAARYCKIKTTDGRFVPFVLNPVQQRLTAALNDQWVRKGLIRMVILKARQQGFSTYFQAYVYWLMRGKSTHNAFVVANDLSTSRALFKQLQDTHREMPPRLRPALAKSSVRELLFAHPQNTSIEIATPNSTALARGRTIHCLWISELAYWAENNSSDSLAGILNCVHNVPGTVVVCESTANGVSGAYYDLYKGAPQNRFETFFAGWYETPSYRDDKLPEGFGEPGKLELTDDEIELQEKFGCDLAQLWWRRQKLAEIGRDAFLKDYPAIEDDAFQASGSPVFSPTALQKQLEERSELETSMTYDEAEDRFFEDGRGALKVWESPKEGREYFIGADTAHGGTKGDYSVAQVLDDRRRQVAMFRAKVSPPDFALILNRLALYYNEAKVIIEINSIGHLVIDRLVHKLGYMHVYRRVVDTKVSEEGTDTLGFMTTKKTKPQIVYSLQEHIRAGSIKINDMTTLEELREFSKHVREDGDDDNARLSAPRGKHDDCVMSLAMANWICEEEWTPIPDDILEQTFLPSY